QHISDEEMESNILTTYTKLYRAYEELKKFVPAGHLFEVKFEEFEADAFGTTRRAYEQLGIPGFDAAEAKIRAYTDKKKGYKKNKYEYKPRTVQLVNDHWGYALKDWGYDRHD
ncbi:MAG: sulfotransferase, partial [Paraprevotella sp.]|nr:sulfotransferase [Paraprevotella sp.]